jgi:HEAT repeat protein
MALFTSGSSDVKTAAAIALGRLQAQEAIPLLIESFPHPKDGYLPGIAGALGMLRDSRATGALIKALRHEPNSPPKYFEQKKRLEDLRNESALALGNIGGVDAFEAIVDALGKSQSAIPRSALSKCSKPILLNALNHDNERVRGAAVEGLAKQENAPTDTLISVALKDVSRDVRAAAINALGSNDDRTIVPVLVALLDDAAWMARTTAATALSKLGWTARSIQQQITLALACEDWNALARLRTGLLVDPLLRYLFRKLAGIGLPGGRFFGTFRHVEDVLLSSTGFSRINERWIKTIIYASGFERRSNQSGEHSWVSIKMSDDAVLRLCRINSPVTSNVLHLISKKEDVTVYTTHEQGFTQAQTLVFQQQRDWALRALQKRGSPPYDPLAYLNPSEARAWLIFSESEGIPGSARI